MSTGKLRVEGRSRTFTILPFLLGCAITAAHAQVPFDSDRWQIESQGHLLLDYQGKEALYLFNGSATLPDVSLRNGVVEFDIAFSGERGFTGVIWRATDGDNFEEFYIRPHQSGNPDANQYRDYRYLGTIGLFDEIYLPLQEGDNEVWFAVTAAFGGWGLMASIEDRAGIRVGRPGTSSN